MHKSILPKRDQNVKAVIECKGVGIDFGGLCAVNDFNILIKKEEICGLIGPNGAGKTTVFNLLTKVYTPTRGVMYLNDKNTKSMNSIEANQSGIARTFQNIRLFKNMTVIENVLVGLHNEENCGIFESIFRLSKYWRSEDLLKKRAMELLSIFGMTNVADHISSSLSYGSQRRLEIIRALATRPSILLLDEPAAGMNSSETVELMENIKKIRDSFGIAILLIEHDMNLVMGVCETIGVLNYGVLIAKGTPREIQNNPVVVEAYLGKAKE
ncbi:MAG: ABC transporter ATP-binding protein [Clostridiales bacterium]|nr:ABC transporter ATP-binding protein [Clostridiales bacterium]